MAWYPAHPADIDEPLKDEDDQGYDEDLDDEGDEPTTPALTPPPPAAVVVRSSQAAKRAALRAPWLAGGTAAAVGYGAWGLADLAESSGLPTAAGAIRLGTCAAAVLALPVQRFRLRNRRQPAAGIENARVIPDPGLFWRAGLFFAGWTGAMALDAADITLFAHPIGWDGMGAVLLTGTAVVFRRWNAAHEIELPTDTPPPVLTAVEPVELEATPEPQRFPVKPPPDEGDLIKREWDLRVAGNICNDEGVFEDNLIAPGATLGDDREALPHGYQWIVELPRSGAVSATQLCQRTEDIALKLGRSKTLILIEPLQGTDDREHRALLTIITKDVLQDGVPYPGPRYLPGGLIPIGKFADGSATPPYWRTKNNAGPVGGLVVGGTRSGKSHLLARLGMAMRKSGEWIVLFGDGDEQGRSAPLLKRVAYDFAAGAAQVKQQLEAIEAWFNARGEEMGDYYEGPDGLPLPITDPSRQKEADKLLPCRRTPGWVWILDEFYLLAEALGRDFVERVGKLMRAMGKRGGTIIVGTQSGTVGDFGGDSVLHGQLKQGNVVLLRTMNTDDQYAVAADFGCDPTLLRPGGGYGFVNGADNRKQMFRGEHDEEMAPWVRSLPEYQPDDYPASVYAYKRPPMPADPIADHAETQRRKADNRARMAAGLPLSWEEQSEPTQPLGGDGSAAPGNAGQVADWAAGIAPPILVGIDDVPGASPEPERRRPLNQSERTVLDQLVDAAGPVRNQPIVSATVLSESVVAKALRELVARGYATKHAQGLHEVTEAGRTWAQAQPAGV